MATKKLNFQNVIMALGAGVGAELVMDKMQGIKTVAEKPYLAPLAVAVAGAWATTMPKMEALGYGALGASGAQLKTTLKLNGLSRINGGGAVDQIRAIKRGNLQRYIDQVKAVAVNGNEPTREAVDSYMSYSL